MEAILHGTWIVDDYRQLDGMFFVWAERKAALTQSRYQVRVRRHPYAATTIEIAQLLSLYVPGIAWSSTERMTRAALLPSQANSPQVPPWLRMPDDEADDAAPHFAYWRLEGIGVPILQMLEVLTALPAIAKEQQDHHIGVDLQYWSLVAKFGLEQLAGQRYVPGLVSQDKALEAVWLPSLGSDADRERLAQLAEGMPPACSAVVRESGEMEAAAPEPKLLLQNFINTLINQAVREWGGGEALLTGVRRPANLTESWWQALWHPDRRLNVPSSEQRQLSNYYQSWQRWSLSNSDIAASNFGVCLRLEQPDYTAAKNGELPPWVLRYFIQSREDPSLLVPASDVWMERGQVLSYLNYNFEHPQERLLESLGKAARISPAIQRSLLTSNPDHAVLSAEEAYTFLRETAHLLEGLGISVLVPPWWSQPDARLHVRISLHAPTDIHDAGMLGMNSLVQYDWQLALGDELITHEEFERLAALKAPLVQMRGRWVLLQPDQVEAAIAFWERQQKQGALPLNDALALALGADEEIDGLEIGDVELDPLLTDLFERITGSVPIEPLETPPDFVGELRPYQERGLAWLAFMGKWGLGACLADDMGLGKTIQAIALLLHVRAQLPELPSTLLICPTSLVGNWKREVERFAPHLNVVVHHGAKRAGAEELASLASKADLVISTYGLARRDLESLRPISWGHIILDEAQNIKNPITKQARAIRRLQGQRRVVLTGTPIENRLSELWSILSFLNPGYLGSLEAFRRAFAVPIERFQDEETSERLRKLVRPFILRRVKTDPTVIQDLPAKFEHKVYCNLTREQVTLYEAVVQDAMRELKEGEQRDPVLKRRGQVLAMLTRLKQICDHPALYLGDGSVLGARSGKLNRLLEMLDEVLATGERSLVFTQYAQMGQLLQRHLVEYFRREVLFLHGGTSQPAREKMIMRFQEADDAPGIFVLSLKAGGTGLNLMRANHVFHFDRWWNPAVENQATDRAFRIGQSRDVQVHKLIAVGTLEDRIDMLIESKRALAESVVGSGEDWLADLSTDALLDLVTLRADALELASDEDREEHDA
ncbi:MAG: DEAD/DEAH box helicase [Chloroflexi bacterium]|nr:DEAD/DEAH box helicase [Chloroflexota bacterium]